MTSLSICRASDLAETNSQHRSEPTQKQYVAKGDQDHQLPNNTRAVSLDPEPFISGTTFPVLSINGQLGTLLVIHNFPDFFTRKVWN